MPSETYPGFLHTSPLTRVGSSPQVKRETQVKEVKGVLKRVAAERSVALSTADEFMRDAQHTASL